MSRLKLSRVIPLVTTYEVSNEGGLVDEKLIQFLYSFGTGKRIFAQLSTLYFDDYKTLSFVKAHNLSYVVTRYTFYANETWQYAIRDEEQPFDIVLDVSDFTLFRKFALEYLKHDGMAILLTEQSTELESINHTFTAVRSALEVEGKLLEVCSLIILTLIDAEVILYKSLEKGFEECLKELLERFNGGYS